MTTASASGEISISAATSSSFPRAIFACSNGQNLQDGELLVLEYPRPDRVRSSSTLHRVQQRRKREGVFRSVPIRHVMANQTWRVGDVTITKLVEVEFTFPSEHASTIIPDADPTSVLAIPWIGPFATPEGKLRGSVHFLLVRTPSARIIVDTGIGNDKTRDLPLFSMRTTPVLDFLRDAGWSPESVDHVICTHLHLDHVGWNTIRRDDTWVPTFPNAVYHFGSRDYEHFDASTSPARRAMFADSITPVVIANLASFYARGTVAVPELTALPTPGHTPGQHSLIVQSRGERIVIGGDVMHHPCQAAHPEWSSDLDDDAKAAEVTRRAFLDNLADTETLLIGTHFAGPTAGRIMREGNAFRFEPDAGVEA